ncbi:zydeco [Carabus blaptoides fortunei]
MMIIQEMRFVVRQSRTSLRDSHALCGRQSHRFNDCLSRIYLDLWVTTTTNPNNMAIMLLRTRRTKVALLFRVICVLGVTVTYTLIGAFSRTLDQSKNIHTVDDSVHPGGRHLLAALEGVNCTPAAIDDFPSDGFTREQRQHGWVAVHAVVACYCFTLLAIVCDDYFVPAVKKICHGLMLAEDVAGATFMAIASSSPELFINCVGTFITEGDLGVGTIVGSAVFNVLAVPACCGLFSNMVLQLDWWPVSRDSAMYGVAVIMLIFVLHDEQVWWYEAAMLVGAYMFYIVAMYFNTGISRFAHRCVGKCQSSGKPRYTEISEHSPLLAKVAGKHAANGNGAVEQQCLLPDTELTLKDCEELEESTQLWVWPSELSAWQKLFWLLTWPISFVLSCTIPDCRKYPKMYVVTFLMCILWIGSTSYMTAWLITVLGDTINIPDSVMGLTFLAAGTSVPEAVSSVIVTNQGHGAMGVSNSIGSNTFDILLCLGLPWLIKSWYFPHQPGHYYVNINSSGLTYSALSLFSTLIMLYTSFACNRFKLDWKVGLTCLLMYIAFLTFASLIELNVFFPVNLPTCDR